MIAWLLCAKAGALTAPACNVDGVDGKTSLLKPVSARARECLENGARHPVVRCLLACLNSPGHLCTHSGFPVLQPRRKHVLDPSPEDGEELLGRRKMAAGAV